MEQFFVIAIAHFFALLSPGPDFFLIARSSLASGWRVASGACLGVAFANGVFIVAAFAGVAALRQGNPAFVAIQLTGCLYLFYLGTVFIRHAGHGVLDETRGDATQRSLPCSTGPWLRALGMGFLSGILNPKNAMFYASLAAMLTGPYASAGWKLTYGVWMFCVVLLWDLLIAAMIGSRVVYRRFSRVLPWLERITGAVLILLALGVATLLALG